MRVCVIDRGARFPVPPEQMPALWEQFIQWRGRWRDKMESFEFFADGDGGFGVVNVADEHELQQMMIEYPFSVGQCRASYRGRRRRLARTVQAGDRPDGSGQLTTIRCHLGVQSHRSAAVDRPE